MKQQIVFECRCGETHRSPDSSVPVGWSTALGQSWCPDCTAAGIPARELPARSSKRRAA